MDLFEAIKGRRSCRNFLPESVEETDLEKILEAATWAPSPLNGQPWEFIVITSADLKEKIFQEAGRCQQFAIKKTNWKWLGHYQLEFLKEVPMIVGVIGDPEKGGIDKFQEDGGVSFHHACAAAIQNMLLAAYARGYATLWFSFFDQNKMRNILRIPEKKVPVALICIGKGNAEITPPPRKSYASKTYYLY